MVALLTAILLATVAQETLPAEITALVAEGRLDEAAELASGALRVVEAGDEPATMELARAIDELTEAARKARPPKADVLPLSERVVVIKEALVGPDDPAVADSLHRLGNLLSALGELEQALQEYERALTIREKAFGPEALELAPTLNNLGTLAKRLGDLSAARRHFERCLAIRERHGATESELSPILFNFGNLLLDLGEYRAAEAHLSRCLTIRERIDGSSSEAVANALNSLASVDLKLGRHPLAEERYARALLILRGLHADDSELAAGILGNLAVQRQEVGDFLEARELQEWVLRYWERNGALKPELLALARNNMGYLLWRTGDPEEARAYLERALELRRELQPEGDANTAMTLNNLTAVAWAEGDEKEARRHATEALAMVERTVGEVRAEAAAALNNLGLLAMRRGDLDEARQIQERTLAIQERLVGTEHPTITGSLVILGNTLSHQGHHEEAKANLARAVALRERFDDGGFPLASALFFQAEVLLRAGETSAALDAALGGEARAREQFSAAARSLSERHALGLVVGRPDSIGAALAAVSTQATPEDLRRVHDAVIRSRALVLEEMLARLRSVHEPNAPQTAAFVEDLREKERRLAQLLLRGADPDHPEEHVVFVEQARREAEVAERALAARSARYRTEQAAREAGFAEIRAALPPRAALVSYVLRRQRYSAFVLRPGAANPGFVDLGPEGEIDDLIRSWHDAAGAPGEEAGYRELAGTLRRAIWDPVTATLGDAREIFVVPEGLLHLVNWYALPADGERYLIETDLQLRILSVERDLVRERQSRPARRNLLAFGAPDFDADPRLVAAGHAAVPTESTAEPGADDGVAAFRGADPERCTDLGAARFEPLPSAREEVEEIAVLWGQDTVSVRVGGEAGEGRFKLSAPGHGALHLAAHAFFLKDVCGAEESTPQLDAPPGATPRIAAANPLFLSGLALAGANRRSEIDLESGVDDGMLTSAEIASIDLRGVEMVVLSACETGGGEIVLGEGVLGLRRAFLTAGAGTVVMSLWRVQDEFATRWMKRFYRARRDTPGSAADAARAASLAMLDSLRRDGRSTHPFYWAAFVAVGE